MVQWIISNIIPILVTALFAVLTVVAKGVGDVIIAYFERKKDALIAKIGADTYDHDLAVARSIWGDVDEEFRITPTLEKTIANKQVLFAEKIKRAIPGITDDEIEQLRQAVAGEVNKGRAALTEPATAGQQATTPPVAPVVGTGLTRRRRKAHPRAQDRPQRSSRIRRCPGRHNRINMTKGFGN